MRATLEQMSDSPAASIQEISAGLFRINVPVGADVFPGGFSYNQYLLVDEMPLLFHTGPRRMFAQVREQIEKVMPVDQLRYIGFSHVEADECGAMAEFLAAAPKARPVCSELAARSWARDQYDAQAVALRDGQELGTGRHQLVWISTPHLPHGRECGFLYEPKRRILFCGDLFAQGGPGETPITKEDIFRASEAYRYQTDFYAYGRETPMLIEKLAQLEPRVLACMHGSAWSGDGASLLRRLGAVLEEEL